MPPLRERPDDIPLLAEHFAGTRRGAERLEAARLHARGARRARRATRWPGNVRELRNVVERLLLLTDDAVDAATVRQVLSGRHVGVERCERTERARGTLAERVPAFEREVVLEELNAHGHRVAETARALGLERSHLYKKCQQLGIDMKGERK